MTEPTQEQIDKAQQAGNAAYKDAMWLGKYPEGCYMDYRAAYDATLAQLQQAAAEVGATAKWYPADYSYLDAVVNAHYECMSAGLPDGIVEHDDWNQGAWK